MHEFFISVLNFIIEKEEEERIAREKREQEEAEYREKMRKLEEIEEKKRQRELEIEEKRKREREESLKSKDRVRSVQLSHNRFLSHAALVFDELVFRSRLYRQ